ncbi:MAG: hypothetical protein ABT20_02025 [Rubrivivax sp. SCN 70-15]|nr:MAG: hypothetical protein ABT20_02025 [Rubrivivax sp. SCN 70-15]
MEIRFIAQAGRGRNGDAALADHARRRLHFRLMHRSDRVAHIAVRLGDTGGRRGRGDTYCVMQVQLRGAPAATVVDIGADAYDTVDRAADRVARLAELQLRGVDAARPPSAGAGAVAA